MKKSPLFLGLSILLFVAWIAYLGVQVWKYRRPPVIVSRAQLIEAKYDVVAETHGSGQMVTVKEILFAADRDGPAVGDTIRVWNLDECFGYAGASPQTYVL